MPGVGDYFNEAQIARMLRSGIVVRDWVSGLEQLRRERVSPKETRLECLRLASAMAPDRDRALQIAQSFLDFVEGTAPDSEQQGPGRDASDDDQPIETPFTENEGE